MREDFAVNALRLGGFAPAYLKTQRGRKTPDYQIQIAGETLILEIGGPSKKLDQLRASKSQGKTLVLQDGAPYKTQSRPLAALGFGKQRVRQLARHFGLSNHALPAAPCLASRVAYGTEVTPERLRRIEQAEALLRELGFTQVRVRVHAGDLARSEVMRDEISRLCELDREGKLSQSLRAIGFPFVTVDLEGFQSGSMNRGLVSIGLPSTDRSSTDRSSTDRSGVDQPDPRPSGAAGSGASQSKEALP